MCVCVKTFSCHFRIWSSFDVGCLDISEPILRPTSSLPTDGFTIVISAPKHVTILAGPNLLSALGGVELLLALPCIGHTGAHCSWQVGPEAATMLAQPNTSPPRISTQEIGDYEHLIVANTQTIYICNITDAPQESSHGSSSTPPSNAAAQRLSRPSAMRRDGARSGLRLQGTVPACSSGDGSRSQGPQVMTLHYSIDTDMASGLYICLCVCACAPVPSA